MDKAQKVDLKKKLKALYNPSAKAVEILDVGPANFIMLEGEGDPNTSEAFQNATEALFGIAYNLKFAVKKGPQQIDYTVMPLEGLWWTEDRADFSIDNKSIWKWTAMIRQPDFIDKAMFETAREEVAKKKGIPDLQKVRFESYHEGLSAQIMHIGPYAAEQPTIDKLHAFIKEKGYSLRGMHHEIYLGDPRRCAPEKLKTVIRQPVEKTE